MTGAGSFRKYGPPVVRTGPGTIPEPELAKLDNGIPVHIFDLGTEDAMKIDFILDAGQVCEDLPLQSAAVASMLTEGSASHSAEEINRSLDFYGTFVNTFSDKDSAGTGIVLITRHIDKIIELCREIIFEPAFREAELDSFRKNRIQQYRVGRERVQVLAMEEFISSIFGAYHPYGQVASERDINSLTPEILRNFHSSYYGAERLSIIISGKIHPSTISLLNRTFGSLGINSEGKEMVRRNLSDISGKKLFLEKENSVQSAIRIGKRTINKRHPDYHSLKVADTILGGYFGSRLMGNIREEKGYTYGISSAVISLNLSGYMLIATDVGAEYTNQTIDEIYKEIILLQKEPVEAEELEMVRNVMLGEMLRMFDGPFAVADTYKAAWEFGLGNQFYYDMTEKIKSITPDEIMHMARTYYNPDDMHEIVVGRR